MIRKIELMGRTYRHFNRYREIAAVLIRHGFGDFVSGIRLEKYLRLGKKSLSAKDSSEIQSLSRWERIRRVLEELGPTFIKFGQIMSNRADLLPQELLAELEKLQDSVPPFSAEDAQGIIEKELGQPIDQIFENFDIEPVASASIAQVHKAVLKSGDVVAVKVQRPGIEEIVKVDLEIMHHLAMLAERYIKKLDIFNPVGIVEEFERAIKKELDFNIEASHIERFAANFQGDMTIYVPRVYRRYTTKKILTMEFIEGVKVSDLDAIKSAGFDTKVIASRGADLILKQIFEHGYFHADPHPGNIFVMKGNLICFLDFGMMGVLSARQREILGDVIIGIVEKDAHRIVMGLLKLSGEDVDDIEGLELRVSELLEEYYYLPLKDVKVGEVLDRLNKLLISYRFKIPPNFYLLLKALITVEGVGRRLDPDFNMVEHIKPFAKRLLMHRINPKKLVKDVEVSAVNLGLLLRDLPVQMREIMEQVKSGKAKVNFEVRGIESLIKALDRITNRIVFAIVLASLVIGSSLIVLSGIPPAWNGIPIIGILGFIMAGIMGFWLLISILRHGRM